MIIKLCLWLNINVIECVYLNGECLYISIDIIWSKLYGKCNNIKYIKIIKLVLYIKGNINYVLVVY